MILDKVLQQQVIPPNIEALCDELTKVLRIVDDAFIPSHLETAECMLRNLSKKWNLTGKISDGKNRRVNLICASIHDRISRKKNEIIIMDNEYANDCRVKILT